MVLKEMSDPLNAVQKREWVKFDNDDDRDLNGPLDNVERVTEDVGTDENRGATPSPSQPVAVIAPIDYSPPVMQVVNLNVTSSPSNDTVVDVNVDKTFKNGDIIVTLLPINKHCAWISPATFRPELVPEELMAKHLTLTVEEYVQVMEQLVNDYRFTMYNMLYKRVILIWLMIAFSILIGLLLCGLEGIMLFMLGIFWLLLNALAIGISIWSKFILNRGLEKCLASINKHLIKHKMLMGVEDRGRMSCHKLTLNFIYYDPARCLEKLEEIIEQQEKNPLNVDNNGDGGWQRRLDVEVQDIVIQGTPSTRLSKKEGRIEQCLVRYSQRWAKDFLRKELDWTHYDVSDQNSTSYHIRPRHLDNALCPCQYIEDILTYKALYRQNRFNYFFDVFRSSKSSSNSI